MTREQLEDAAMCAYDCAECKADCCVPGEPKYGMREVATEALRQMDMLEYWKATAELAMEAIKTWQISNEEPLLLCVSANTAYKFATRKEERK